ncbi:Uncharacterised protein [Vibrio cholerae]|nr:Uncharacterised protein [Vibrio cholerae]
MCWRNLYCFGLWVDQKLRFVVDGLRAARLTNRPLNTAT